MAIMRIESLKLTLGVLVTLCFLFEPGHLVSSRVRERQLDHLETLLYNLTGSNITNVSTSVTNKDGMKLTLAIMQLDIKFGPRGAYGLPCITKCSKKSRFGHEWPYFFCYTINDDWDYCSPQNGTDYRGLACKEGECPQFGEGMMYTWCHVGESWGYCSQAQ